MPLFVVFRLQRLFLGEFFYTRFCYLLRFVSVDYGKMKPLRIA